MSLADDEGTGPALDVLRAAGFGAAGLGRDGAPVCAFVLGTGLGGLADELTDARRLAYADIPGFPASGVSGHAGALVEGVLAGRRVLIFQGRAHYYEHGRADVMRLPLAVAAELGVTRLVLTNAAGSCRADIRPGAIALIEDHINYSGLNPLIGDQGEGRFVPMTDAYDAGLRAALVAAARVEQVALARGVYMWFSGPSFETPAEVRMAARLGADLVGMSTVPEVILARRLGLKVAALSAVTNLGAGIEGASPSHAETKEVALQAAGDLKRVIRAFVARMGEERDG
jgi:purine-nucleoside phosphorylase